MDYSTIAKYAAAGALLASIYVLVWFSMMDPQQYRDLVIMALSALGINAVSGSNKS